MTGNQRYSLRLEIATVLSLLFLDWYFCRLSSLDIDISSTKPSDSRYHSQPHLYSTIRARINSPCSNKSDHSEASLSLVLAPAMLPMKSLLNPLSVVPHAGRPRHTIMPPTPSSTYTDELPSPVSPDYGLLSMPTPPRSSTGAAPLLKMEHRGRGFSVNYAPFEDLDEPSLREVRRFQVRPFGSIRETSRHIPYNSGKKDFFAKTGRESFEGMSWTPVW